MEDEMVSTHNDKRVGGLPRHDKGRVSGAAPKPAALWDEVRTEHPPEPCYGRYPKGFLARQLMRWNLDTRRVLHVCSGAMTSSDALGGVRVDLRTAARPDVRADGRALPFRDGAFAGVCIDPPYSLEYARDLYGIAYPRPSHLLREAARVVAPGGLIGLLHYLVPSPPPGTSFVSVSGITQGCGYRIRAWTVYRRDAAGLFGGP